jgi:hypothetical protein
MGAVLGGVVSTIGNIGTRLKTPAALEASRQSWADATYAKAIAGDAQALQDLKNQAGVGIPGAGAATAQAKAYILSKYQQAVAVLGSGKVAQLEGTPAAGATAGTGMKTWLVVGLIVVAVGAGYWFMKRRKG